MGCGVSKKSQIAVLQPVTVAKGDSQKTVQKPEADSQMKESVATNEQTKASAIQPLAQKAKSLEERVAKTPWLSESFLLNKIEELGEGSYGKVFGVIWKKTMKSTALKYVFVQDEDEFNSMEKEINLLLTLRNIGNVVQILDKHVVESTHELYILMEKGDYNLKQFLVKRKYEVDFDMFLQMFADLAFGLNLAHKRRVIHSDIKPGNVLVFENANRSEVSNIQNTLVKDETVIFKLTDWGAGCSNSTGKTTRLKTGMAFTTAYAAPEVLMDDEHVNFEKADIYSLGMTLLNCCGVRFEDMKFISGISKKEKHDKEIGELLEDIPKKYNEKMQDLLKQMLKFDRHERVDLDKAFELLAEVKPSARKLIKKQTMGPNLNQNDGKNAADGSHNNFIIIEQEEIINNLKEKLKDLEEKMKELEANKLKTQKKEETKQEETKIEKKIEDEIAKLSVAKAEVNFNLSKHYFFVFLLGWCQNR